MTLNEILHRLENPRQLDAGKYAARCPAHDDRVGSLVISEGDNAIVFHCHAGCGSGDVREAMGLEWRDLFFSSPAQRGGVVNIGDVRPAQSPSTPGERRSQPKTNDAAMPPNVVVQSWEHALDGPLLTRLLEIKGWSERTLRRVRAGWDGQRVTFPAYAADGAMVGLLRYLPGGEPKMLAVGPRGLWPAPESLPAGDVWIVEGEPDRVSALELGLNATCVPGIGKWSDDWAQRFQGRRVIVCMDCDEACCDTARDGGGKVEDSKACGACGAAKRRTYGGREHADRVVRELGSANVHATAVDLFPARTDGYDLGDALTHAAHERRVDDLRRYLIQLEDHAWRVAA